MQLESLWGVTGPGADRGGQPVQQLAHMLSIELHHWIQILHLTQAPYTIQGLRERRRHERTGEKQNYVNTFFICVFIHIWQLKDRKLWERGHVTCGKGPLARIGIGVRCVHGMHANQSINCTTCQHFLSSNFLHETLKKSQRRSDEQKLNKFMRVNSVLWLSWTITAVSLQFQEFFRSYSHGRHKTIMWNHGKNNRVDMTKS